VIRADPRSVAALFVGDDAGLSIRTDCSPPPHARQQGAGGVLTDPEMVLCAVTATGTSSKPSTMPPMPFRNVLVVITLLAFCFNSDSTTVTET
jgi:hypothetical protein